ncbi:cytochrome P450 2G1-like [Anolis sagrei]|uniref:cytochrome P450 2G1-like n=1 Tax=Anolis sagrei TaxID=38937 RepID=UPI0035221EBE
MLIEKEAEEKVKLPRPNSDSDRKVLDPTDPLRNAVSNIISSIVFGDRFDYEDEEFQALMRLINDFYWEASSTWSQLYDMFPTFLKYFPGPHNRVYDIMSHLSCFIAKRVKKNQETLDPNFPRDFIDCYLIQMEKEKGNPLSEFTNKNLEVSIFTLFFAGTETVSSTLRYGFLFLMKYPEVQAKVHEEIDRVIGHNRIPNNEDQRQMPYTDAVIHEIQRFCDLVPMNVAHMVTCDTEFRGYFIPKGMEVCPVLSSVLHDPTMFKNPNAFNPENFLDENGCFKKNDAFVPFSSGKRICLGESMARMQLFLFFTTILQSFQLKPLVPPEDLDPTPLETGFISVPPIYQLSFIPR